MLVGVDVLLMEKGAGEPVEAEVKPNFIGEGIWASCFFDGVGLRALFYISRKNSI